MTGGDGAVDFEKPADIEPALFHWGNAEIPGFPGVHFEVGAVGDAADMRLEAYPFPGGGFPAGTPDHTGLSWLGSEAGLGVDLHAEAGCDGLESIVKEVTGEAECRLGKDMSAGFLVSGKPGDASVPEGIGKDFRNAECFQGALGNARDKLPANPVARIGSRLVEDDGDAPFAEGNCK